MGEFIIINQEKIKTPAGMVISGLEPLVINTKIGRYGIKSGDILKFLNGKEALVIGFILDVVYLVAASSNGSFGYWHTEIQNIINDIADKKAEVCKQSDHPLNSHETINAIRKFIEK